MQIKLLHLYYDIFNMYGENGNMRALVKRIENQGVKVIVDFKSIEDEINFNEYDGVYIGTGLDESYKLVLDDFKKYKKEIKNYINNNKMFIATGNSVNLFADLDILDFKVKQVDFRIIGEQVYDCSLINKTVIGFQNRDTVIYDNKENTLFNVNKGTGLEPNVKVEGISKNNFYGTYLLGPLLIRNPYFVDYLVQKLFEFKKYEYKDVKEDISYRAYKEFLKNFINNQES